MSQAKATAKILNGHALVQFDNGGIAAVTDIDVLREQLVRHLVFLQYVVVGARAREGGAEEETEESVFFSW